MHEYAKSVAELHGIEVAVPTSARKRRLPERFEECVLLRDAVSLCHLVRSTKESSTFLL